MRVVIAEDSVFRNSIERMLAAAGHDVVCVARTGAELLAHLNGSEPPDVAVLDIRMPPTKTDEGLVTAEKIRARWPSVGILLFSAYILLPMAERLLGLGGDGGLGYLSKDGISDEHELAAAVERVGAGDQVLDQQLFVDLMRRRREKPLEDLLSGRELDVLRLIAEGRTNQVIADTLFISVKSVEDNCRSLFRKLDVASEPRIQPARPGSARVVSAHGMSAAVRPPLLAPGSVPSWRVATARAAAVAAAVVAFGVLAQWPLASSRNWLFASNLVVAGGFAAGSVLLSDEPRHARTRWALLVASVLWSVAWVQGWNSGPLPFLASLTGPAPAAIAIWGLLQFPRPWHNRQAARAVLALIVIMQVVSFATTFTEPHPSGAWWPRVEAPGLHAGLLTLYNVGGVVCTIALAGLFAARVARLRGHELRITIPIGVAVVAGGLATALSDTAAAAGDNGRSLWAFYAWEDLLLVCVPASFILSYILRRVCIEELSGRIDAYDTLPQACAKLQRALRDPTLQILLPGTSPGQWVDADGRRQPAPAEDAGRLLVPVLDEHQNRVAVVSVHPSLARFGDLLTATAQSLVLVLDNARLVAQLRDELSLVEQSHLRVEAAVAAERRQIRHRTGAGPLTLTDAARRHLDSAMAALTTAAQPVPDALVAARATITHAADDIRLLSSGAEPVGLGNGLAEAIPRVLEVHPAIRVDVAELRADPEVERVAYFVITAAVGNAIKYAGPDAAISVTIASADGPEGKPTAEGDAGPGFLAVEVRDDGPGGANPAGHGLTLMAERVASVGGDLRITSQEGEGTAIRAILPRRL